MGKYKVAGHVFEISMPEGFAPDKYLKAYQPFTYDGDDFPLFSLRVEVTEDLDSVSSGRVVKCFNDEPPYLWVFENDKYYFGFSHGRSGADCILVPDDDYKNNTLYIPAKSAEDLADFASSNALMLLYTYNTTPYDTLLIHSSVIVKDGEAHSFLGKSGTGKSTHSRLWLENIEGAHLLNDDNPVVRVVGGQVLIYGSPWSGKTHCYKNEVYPLKSVVRLTQAPYNKIKLLQPLQSYASFLPSCSSIKWDSKQTDALHKTVEQVVKSVSCWGLECLPDADAAHVCMEAVTV